MSKQSISIQLKNIESLKAAVRDIKTQSERVISSTLSDLRRKGPATVRTHVGAKYNINKKEIQPGAVKRGKNGSVKEIKQAADIRITGETIDTFTMVYTGRPLTALHFGMTPKKPAALLPNYIRAPGKKIVTSGKSAQVAMVRPRKKYKITMTVEKGSPEVLDGKFNTPPFLAPAKAGSSTMIPFQRVPGDKPSVVAFHSLSVPQMIDNPEVNAAIYDDLSEYTTARINHHSKRFMK